MSSFAMEGSPNKVPPEPGADVPPFYKDTQQGIEATRSAADQDSIPKDEHIRNLQKQVLVQQSVMRELQSQVEDSQLEVQLLRDQVERREMLFEEQKGQLKVTKELLERAMQDLAEARSEAGFRNLQSSKSRDHQIDLLRAMTRKAGLEKLQSAQQNRDHARTMKSLEIELHELHLQRRREVDELTNHVKVLIDDRADLIARLRAASANQSERVFALE